MRAWQRLASGLVCLACLLPASAARAQVSLDTGGLLQKRQPKPEAPAVPAPALVWPRLDPGAVLCRTEADLSRLAANRTGGAGGGPADCHLIAQTTPIHILQRQGPGRTEVQVTPDHSDKAGETGWTDSWLPPRPPSVGR